MALSSNFEGSANVPDTIQAITGGFMASGTAVTAVSAPGVQTVGSASTSANSQNSLSILNNALVSNVNFPSLTSIAGNLEFANNPDINSIDGFGQLASVGGNVDLTGTFSSVSLPNLNNVGGGVNIQSSNAGFACPIGADRTNGVIKGNGFVCAGNIKNPTPGVTGANFTANTFPPSSTSEGLLSFQLSSIWAERVFQCAAGLYFMMI